MPTNESVYRAVVRTDMEIVKREATGIALPLEKWQMVRDLRGPAYPEAHARTSLDVTLRVRPEPRPFFYFHEYATSDPAAEPIGVASFHRGGDALYFRAYFARTRKASEHLELVKAGAEGAVSVGLDLLQSQNVRRPEGVGRLRTESRIKELSLAPVGFGQFPEAKVDALRARGTSRPPDTLHERRAERLRMLHRARAQDLRMVEAGQLLRAHFDLQWGDFDAEHGAV